MRKSHQQHKFKKRRPILNLASDGRDNDGKCKQNMDKCKNELIKNKLIIRDKTVFWNIQGIYKIRNVDVVKYLSEYDINFLVETWIDSNINIALNGYECKQKDAKKWKKKVWWNSSVL